MTIEPDGMARIQRAHQARMAAEGTTFGQATSSASGPPGDPPPPPPPDVPPPPPPMEPAPPTFSGFSFSQAGQSRQPSGRQKPRLAQDTTLPQVTAPAAEQGSGQPELRMQFSMQGRGSQPGRPTGPPGRGFSLSVGARKAAVAPAVTGFGLDSDDDE